MKTNRNTKKLRAGLASLLVVLVLGSVAPAWGHTFVNRLSFEVLLYPSSRPNKVIALQPNQCVQGRWGEIYTIVYYTAVARNEEDGRDKSRYENPRAYCQSIAGGKMQCTRQLTVPNRQTGGIWLSGSTVETGMMSDFSDDQCLGEVRRL